MGAFVGLACICIRNAEKGLNRQIRALFAVFAGTAGAWADYSMESGRGVNGIRWNGWGNPERKFCIKCGIELSIGKIL